jgi:glycosyltransferase involved in cell wall biosynthesis
VNEPTPREHSAELTAQALYNNSIRVGSALASVRSPRPASLEFESATHGSTTFESVTEEMFQRRALSSRFLSDAEWSELLAFRHTWKLRHVMEQIELLHRPWRRRTSVEKPDLVVLYARALQSQFVNGTVRHANSIAQAIVAALPTGYRLALLTDDTLPELSPELFPERAVPWRPAELCRVQTFVQLGTVVNPLFSANLDLLRAPWIHTMSVFLDDIQGLYPSYFIGTQTGFWIHQLAIEKMKASKTVLTLGRTSDLEARALWSTLPAVAPQPEFIITSCSSGLSSSSNHNHPQKASSEFLVFGNSYPHKNLAIAAAALASFQQRCHSEARLQFVSDLPEDSRDALRELAKKTGAAPSADTCLRFSTDLTDEELERLIRASTAVIIPSLHEGFSLPVIEALERGVPVILSRIPAHQELLPEGPWFFDPTSVTSLVTAMVACHNSTVSWVGEQKEGLGARYDSNLVNVRIADALSRALVPVSAEQYSGALKPSGLAVAPEKTETKRDISAMRENLVQQDASFMRPLIQSRRPLEIDSVDHKTILRILHESRNWQIGNRITAPFLNLQKRLAKLRRR